MLTKKARPSRISEAKEKKNLQALDNLRSEVEDYKKEHMAQSTKVAAQVYVLEEVTQASAAAEFVAG